MDFQYGVIINVHFYINDLDMEAVCVLLSAFGFCMCMFKIVFNKGCGETASNNWQ